jgi:glutamate formiminotransferase / 5-formyltetrahydrofolate cyclo-ligase
VAQFSLVEMTSPILLTIPNVSEGRDAETIAAIGTAFAGGDGMSPGGEDAREVGAAGVHLLDIHSDGDHHRTVFTLAGQPGELADALLRGAREVVERIDIGDGRGAHPHVGALDVVPVVYLDAYARGAACVEALVTADRIGEELEVPVFLYGELSGGRPRAELRRGGVAGLAERMGKGELKSDFGPAKMHSSAGATLVAARPPLVAFNLRLATPATAKDARRIAALIREGGAEGLPGVRAIGVALSAHKLGLVSEQRSHNPRVGGMDGDHVAQISMNLERPSELPLRVVVEAVRRHAQVASGELVGLAPRAALEGFPADLLMPGFDPQSHVIENALGC